MQELSGYEKIGRLTRVEEGKEIKAQITIPLDIPDVRVLHIEVNPQGDYTITIESTLEGTNS